MRRFGVLLVRLVVLVGTLLISIDAWLAHTWESLSVDEVLYHVRAPLSGTDMTVVWEYLLHYGSLGLAVFAMIGIMRSITSRHGRVAAALATVGALALGAGMAFGAVWDFGQRTGLSSYLTMVDDDFIGAHYVDPKTVQITFPEHKRNLIYLYLESMEVTYSDRADGGAFDKDVIPELTGIALENEDFSGDDPTLDGGIVLPGTGWTIGAMFAQSSGVPLKLPFKGNSMGELDTFFPGLTTLGNILQDEGYHQTLLIGSDADFAARREYFLEHGNFDIYDYNRARDEGVIDPDYRVFWGFEDERLFAWARELLPQIASEDQPFNLTILTVDTHFEDGYVCRLCDDEFDDQYANVMACSSRQVGEFVDWLQQQDFWDDTTLIIAGDHTTMDTDFCEDVPDDYQRKTYVAVVNGATEPEDPTETRTYSTLDLFPTTVEALGATIQGGRLGLGTSLYRSRPTIVEQYGVEACSEALSRQSAFLNGYSEAQISDDLLARALNKCYLTYRRGTHGMTGIALVNFDLINAEMIESARLEVVNDRTGQTFEYDLETYQENPNSPNGYNLVVRRYISPEDLKYLRAKAYVTVTGHDEIAVAAWTGTEGNILLSEYEELEEAAHARGAQRPGQTQLTDSDGDNVLLSF